MKSFLALREAESIHAGLVELDRTRGDRKLAERFIGKIRQVSRNAELQPDEVHVRGMWLCNSERDHYMSRFTLSALDEIAELLPGRPVMSGHQHYSLPIGRFFAAERTFRDDLHRPKRDNYWVRGLFYTLAGDPEGDAIARRIDGGIYQEVSIGWRCLDANCSLCMNPINDRNRCPHVPGELYEEGICDYEFSGVTAVLEGSLVFAGGRKDTSMFTPEATQGAAAGKADERRVMTLEEFLAADELDEREIPVLKRGFVAEVPELLSPPSLRQLRPEVQMVKCSRTRFPDAAAARKWVRDHDWRADGMDDSGQDYIQFRQWPDAEVIEGSDREREIPGEAGVRVRLCKRKERGRQAAEGLRLEEVFTDAA